MGSNAVPWATFRDDDFQLTGDTLRRYASSPGVTRTFCERCGSSLTYEIHSRPGEIDVTQGTLDDPTQLDVEGHIWLEDAAPWEHHAHRLPTAPRNPPLNGPPLTGRPRRS